jgi:hypothetical protein
MTMGGTGRCADPYAIALSFRDAPSEQQDVGGEIATRRKV